MYKHRPTCRGGVVSRDNGGGRAYPEVRISKYRISRVLHDASGGWRDSCISYLASLVDSGFAHGKEIRAMHSPVRAVAGAVRAVADAVRAFADSRRGVRPVQPMPLPASRALISQLVPSVEDGSRGRRSANQGTTFHVGSLVPGRASGEWGCVLLGTCPG